MARKKINPSLFEDSSSLLELAAFKKKIKRLYDEILERVYKAENPGASPEEVQAYVEENGLQFPDEVDTEEQEDEIDNLMDMLDDMVDTDVQEPVSALSTEDKPKEHKGDELSSKSHEKGDKVETKDLKDKMGGLFSVKTDERKRTSTKAPEIPTGPVIKRDTSTAHKTEFAPLVEKFRDELRSLADRQRSGVQQLRDRL
jgi:predicted transcriptional regulator